MDIGSVWRWCSLFWALLSTALDSSEKWKLVLAIALLAGAALFPFSVLIQTLDHGPLPRALSVTSSGLMIAAMAAAAWGLALNRPRV
jgi:hypothetical protein